MFTRANPTVCLSARGARCELDPAVIHPNHEVNGVCCEVIFDLLGAGCEKLSEYFQAQCSQLLAALAFCCYDVIIELADLLRFRFGIVTTNHCYLFAHGGYCLMSRRPAALLAALSLAPPKLAHYVVACHQAVVPKALPE